MTMKRWSVLGLVLILFSLCWIAGLWVVFGAKRVTEPCLRDGESVNIDFGFATATDYDFTAQSEISLKNAGNRRVVITGIKKSCPCQSVILSPEGPVEPGGDLRVRFVHRDATSGKGGYFYDRLLLKIRDVNSSKEGGVVINYSGFVNKRSFCVPGKFDVRNKSRRSGSISQSGVLFLTRLDTSSGKCVVADLPTIHSIQAPKGIAVRIVNKSERRELQGTGPRTIIPDPRIWKHREATETELRLEQFLARKKYTRPSELWESFLVVLEVGSVDYPIDDVLVVRTDVGEVRIPVTVSVPDELVVQPKAIAFCADSGRIASIHVRNMTGAHVEVRSVTSDSSLLTLQSERLSDSEIRIKICLPEDLILENTLRSKVFIQTNIGAMEVPYSAFVPG